MTHKFYMLSAGLALALIVVVVPVHAEDYFPGCPSWNHTVTFVNNCSASLTVIETPGCFPDTNSNPPFNGGKCWPQEAGGQFTLAASGGRKQVSIMSCWSGNYGVQCDNCKVAISTLAEMTFDGGLSSTYAKLPGLMDTYDVSMVDGFVVPIEFKPDPSVPQGGGNCSVGGCSNTPQCPTELQNGSGSCLSPCQHAISSGMSQEDQEKYCCVCSMTQAAACTFDSSNPTKVPAACQGKYGCSPFSQPGNSNPGSACCPWYNQGEACSAATADRAWSAWAQDYIKNVHAA